MSGYSSIANRLYDTIPRTTSATIIMVANTGRLIETLERNIVASWLFPARGCACRTPGLPARSATACTDDLNLHSLAQTPDIARHYAVALSHPRQSFGNSGPVVNDSERNCRRVNAAFDNLVNNLSSFRRLVQRRHRHHECVADATRLNRTRRKSSAFQLTRR